MKLADWQIKDFTPGGGDIEALRSDPGTDWIACPAPGDTYLALHAAGRIPHPFAAENETACAWVKDREWWWRSSFTAEPAAMGERPILAFDGLDTYATVWLNGELLGESDNMFLAARFDVSAQLSTTCANDLLIRFTPPSVKVADKMMETWDIIADPIKTSKRNFIRKAQFGWGWDWGPALPTVGLWRPVRLERQKIASVAHVCFTTVSIGQHAVVEIEASLDTFAAAQPLRLALDLVAPDGKSVAAQTLAVDTASLKTTLTIADPQLWWTPELGGQPLYRLEATLLHGDDIVDRHRQRVGLRTITLDTSADAAEPGTNFFRFVLNDIPVFARGANWIPASSFVGALSRADYEPLLRAAAEANMNMLRVWGGGVYEQDAFYDLCDELGLLVWQDFMFACAPYPEHEAAFVDSVRKEVVYQVERLRNHPALAVWCGNNEGQAVHQFMDRMHGRSTAYLGDLYCGDIIPQTLARLDPATPYWPGSPYGGPSHNSMRAGDVHNWTVWHGLPPVPDDVPVGGFDHSPEAVAYTRYAEDMARFVSEFGIQASPSLATLKRWLTPDQMQLGSTGFLNRIKDHPQNKVDAMLIPVTGLPQTLEQYVDFTQLVQAEGLKFGIEHYRRRKPHCSGTLLWQFNDCWPGISWSLVDHSLVRKPSWYAVARAYAPVMASFKALPDGTVEMWVVNDTSGRVSIEASVAMTALDGQSVWRETIQAQAPANSSSMLWRASAGRIGDAKNNVLTVRSSSFPANRHFFSPFKDLPLTSSAPAFDCQTDQNGGLLATVTGTSYHVLVHLDCIREGITFSDNDFDLMAGESRTLKVQLAEGKLLPSDITIRSLLASPRP
ncbi:MAG: beta-galactosidase/beta-glucuronidase [Collimonas fungivorans]|uniref:beta-mannosidase n=1 Tax=Collimonas fungivorans TaxID=158899 RepID=UPI0026ED9A0D|nr:glycoside hydrolase family 2 protein [Collimonas fungivorans]MDB5769293.1 beta-galactosidase/beta-glucuronidase [Collimonas fungivorans]